MINELLLSEFDEEAKKTRALLERVLDDPAFNEPDTLRAEVERLIGERGLRL